jgi:hypothetical protein
VEWQKAAGDDARRWRPVCLIVNMTRECRGEDSRCKTDCRGNGRGSGAFYRAWEREE